MGFIFILIILALVFPITNLLVGVPPNRLSDFNSEDGDLNKAAAIMAMKCVNCHTSDYKLPFYASFPIAKGMIEKDIQEGTEYLDLIETIHGKGKEPVSEVVLAKIEQTTSEGSMPPGKYLLLHWNGGLSQEENDVLYAWINQTREKHYATEGVSEKYKHEVIQPLPLSLDLDPQKVAMGNEIFHDKRLSKDNTLSCASCHGLDKGGCDQQQFSEGVGGAMGDINAPTVFNAGFQIEQFWDGRAPTLEEQAKGPVENPIEMADNWDDVIKELNTDADFVKRFEALYPTGVNVDNIVSAIADFERSLNTINSKVDRYLMGDENSLSAEEKEGFKYFKMYGCATCHVGKIVGGQSYERMGRKEDYFEERGNVHKPDYGRFNFTGKEEDRFYFKVPTLRNIALTFPYLHDGFTSELGVVVQTMAECEVGKTIPALKVEKIIKFLKALTGEYNGKPLQ